MEVSPCPVTPPLSFRAARPQQLRVRVRVRVQGLDGLFGGQLVFIRTYSGNSEPLYKSKTAYYEILQVTPTATLAQIKTAYYKQSFIYHPDRNKGEEATLRFSDIAEAYAVLGNNMLRKKYDRGLLTPSDLLAPGRPSGKDATAAGSAAARQQPDGRRSVMGADSRGGVFNFDAFFKDHYSEQLQREKEIRARREEMKKEDAETLEDKKMDRLVETGTVLVVVAAGVLLLSIK